MSDEVKSDVDVDDVPVINPTGSSKSSRSSSKSSSKSSGRKGKSSEPGEVSASEYVESLPDPSVVPDAKFMYSGDYLDHSILDATSQGYVPPVIGPTSSVPDVKPKSPMEIYGTSPVYIVNISEISGEQRPVTHFEFGSHGSRVVYEVPLFYPGKIEKVSVQSWLGEVLLRYYGPTSNIRKALVRYNRDDILVYRDKWAKLQAGELKPPLEGELSGRFHGNRRESQLARLPTSNWPIQSLVQFSRVNNIEVPPEISSNGDKERLVRYLRDTGRTILMSGGSVVFNVG